MVMPKLCYAGLILSFVSIPIVLILEINRHPHSQEAFKGNSSLHRSIPKLFVQLFSATKDNVAIKDTTTETQVNYAYSALPSDLLLSLLQKSHSKAQYFTGSSFLQEIHVRSRAIVVPEFIFYEGSWVTPAGYTASCVTKSSLLPY